MDDLLQKLILKFPFMSHVKYGDSEYIGIVQNRDAHCTSFYNYEKITDPDLKKLFLELGDAWWMVITVCRYHVIDNIIIFIVYIV